MSKITLTEYIKDCPIFENYDSIRLLIIIGIFNIDNTSEQEILLKRLYVEDKDIFYSIDDFFTYCESFNLIRFRLLDLDGYSKYLRTKENYYKIY